MHPRLDLVISDFNCTKRDQNNDVWMVVLQEKKRQSFMRKADDKMKK